MTCATLERIQKFLPVEVSDTIAERLTAHGIRPTLQRMMIARLLFTGENKHVSAEVLHKDIVNARVPVSLATVYNTLNQFTAAGLLQEVVLGDKKVFDTNTKDHIHVFYEDTAEIEDIFFEKRDLLKFLGLNENTEILETSLVLRVKGR